jgi:hypothetical protein
MLQDNPELELMLEGHADAREDHPIELSRARAVAIRKWLVANGVTCALGVLPCGAAYPVAYHEFFMLMRILLRSASFTVPKPDEENPSDELARSHEENERSIVFSVRVHTLHTQV